MKKLRNLLVILLLMMIAVPFNVEAKKELPEVGKEPVKVYMFRSNTCGYCEAALEWFNSIEKEYGDYFDLVDYEVSTEENSKLWNDAAEVMGDTASGVPYIVVGKYSYPNGFASDSLVDSNSEKTMGEELIERVLEIYESDNRFDVIKEVNNKPNYDTVVGVIALVVIAGLIVVAVITRRQSK